MGYTTDFTGKFRSNKPFDADTLKLINGLNTTRRMKRNVGPEYGIEGEFYIDGKGHAGQDHEPNVVSHNEPPSTQPSLWCQWAPFIDHNGEHGIEWDGGEKFYHYVDWITYLVEKILAPRFYELTGTVEWHGEDSDDFGRINIISNQIIVQHGQKVYL